MMISSCRVTLLHATRRNRRTPSFLRAFRISWQDSPASQTASPWPTKGPARGPTTTPTTTTTTTPTTTTTTAAAPAAAAAATNNNDNDDDDDTTTTTTTATTTQASGQIEAHEARLRELERGVGGHGERLDEARESSTTDVAVID